MLNQAESSRRRELQRRAFAAGGGVTDAERAELRDLDARAAAAPVPPAAPTPDDPASSTKRPQQALTEQALTEPPLTEQPLAEPPLTEQRLTEQRLSGPRSDAGDDLILGQAVHGGAAEREPSADADGAALGRRRPSIPVLVLSTLIALLLGFGGGWLLLSRDSTPAMTAEQAKAMAEIEKTARFDPGSVVYLGEKYDASVWRATSEGGERVCLAIQVGDRDQYQCTPPPDDDTAFAEPVGVSVSRADDEGDWSYWATLLNDISGREVVIIQRHDMSAAYGWESQYTDEELRQIRMLEAEGIVPNYLQIIGYDGDVPVFISQDGRTCIYVVDPASNAVVQSCDPSDDGVYVLQVNGATYEVRETNSRGPMLTIVRNRG